MDSMAGVTLPPVDGDHLIQAFVKWIQEEELIDTTNEFLLDSVPIVDEGVLKLRCLKCEAAIKVQCNAGPDGGGYKTFSFKRHWERCVREGGEEVSPEKRLKAGVTSYVPVSKSESESSVTATTSVNDKKKNETYVGEVTTAITGLRSYNPYAVGGAEFTLELCVKLEKFGIVYEVSNDVTLSCRYCRGVSKSKQSFKKKVFENLSQTTCKAMIHNVKEHLISESHFQLRGLHQKTMDSFFYRSSPSNSTSLPEKLSEYSNPRVAAMCLGLRSPLGSDAQLALEDVHPASVKTFTFNFQTVSLKTATATFELKHGVHSNSCVLVSPFEEHTLPNMCCIQCQKVGMYNKEYRTLIRRWKTGYLAQTKDSALAFDSFKKLRIKNQRETNNRLRLQSVTAANKVESLTRLYEPFKMMKEDSSFFKTIGNLYKCRNAGNLKDGSLVQQFISNYASNFAGMSPATTRRHEEGMKRLAAALKIQGGRKSMLLATENLLHIGESTIDRYIRKERVVLQSYICSENFEGIAEAYKGIKEELGIPSNEVTVTEVQMDESSIIKNISVIALENGTWELIGFCGKKKTPQGQHTCFGTDRVIVSKYEELIQAFEEYQIAIAISAVIIQPLDRRLPALPVGAFPVCMCFTKADMVEVWSTFERLYRPTIGAEFRYPTVTGFGSDGCFCRVPIQQQRMKLFTRRGGRGRGSTEVIEEDKSNRFHLLDVCDCFGLGGTKDDEGYVKWLDSQDWLHCLKKMMACVDSGARQIYIGNNLISKLGVWKAIGGGGIDWGVDRILNSILEYHDFERRDRMNVQSMQNLFKLSVLLGLAKDNENIHTFKYWWVMFMTRMIFGAVKLPLQTRVAYCGQVITYFYGWYHLTKEGKNGVTMKNFVTQETFRDLMIALNTWMLKLCLMRDLNKDDYPSFLLGSNAVELFFSSTSGWGELEAMKRNITMADVNRATSNTVTLWKWRGATDEGRLKIKDRNSAHNPELKQMVGDEERLMREPNLFTGIYAGVVLGVYGKEDDKLDAITNDVIKHHAEVGIQKSLKYFRDHGLLSASIRNDDGSVNRKKLFDHTILNYKKDTARDQATRETPGENHAPPPPPPNDDAPPPAPPGRDEEVDIENVFELDDIGLAGGDELRSDDLQDNEDEVPDENEGEGGDIEASTITVSGDVGGPVDNADGEEIEVESNEEFQKALRARDDIAIATAEVLLEEELQSETNLQTEPDLTPAQKKGGNKKYQMKDKDGVFYDIRVVTAILSRYAKYKVLTKGTGVGRKDRVTATAKESKKYFKLNTAADPAPHESCLSFFEMGDWVALHFFDEVKRGKKVVKVKPAIPKVWIGKIDKIVKIEGKRCKHYLGEFEMGRVDPSIKISCKWLSPCLDEGEKNPLAARKFTELPPEKQKQHRGFFSGQIVFYKPKIYRNDDGTYSLEEEDAILMEEKYEAYNFEGRSVDTANNGASRDATAGSDDDEEEEEEEDDDNMHGDRGRSDGF